MSGPLQDFDLNDDFDFTALLSDDDFHAQSSSESATKPIEISVKTPRIIIIMHHDSHDFLSLQAKSQLQLEAQQTVVWE